MRIFILLLLILGASPAFSSDATLSIGYAPLDGGVYVGGEKTPASFYRSSLSYRGPGDVYGGLDVSYLYNQSATKTWAVLGILGKNFYEENSWKIQGEALLGAGWFKEKTNIQDVSGSGLSMGLSARALYSISSKVNIGLGYEWIHYSFANSFWGEDISQDLVIDQKGFVFILEYRF